MAAREFLIKSTACTLSELAGTVKALGEITQNPKYPSFELLPAQIHFNKDFVFTWKERDGPVMKAGEDFLLLRCAYSSGINKLHDLLPKRLKGTLEGACTLDVDFDEYQKHVDIIKFESLEEMISDLQTKERKERKKSMNKDNKEDNRIGISSGYQHYITSVKYPLSEVAAAINNAIDAYKESVILEDYVVLELGSVFVKIKEDKNVPEFDVDVKKDEKYLVFYGDHEMGYGIHDIKKYIPEEMFKSLIAQNMTDMGFVNRGNFEVFEYGSVMEMIDTLQLLEKDQRGEIGNLKKIESSEEMISDLQTKERKGEKTMAKTKKNMAIENEQQEVSANEVNGQQQTAEASEKKERKFYLSLPPKMKKETFAAKVNELKENGAKFDTFNKAWYITEDMDFNQFKNYLGVPYEYVFEKGKEQRAWEAENRKNREDKGQEDRVSIKDKLNQNKEALDKNTPEKKEPEHSRDEAR